MKLFIMNCDLLCAQVPPDNRVVTCDVLNRGSNLVTEVVANLTDIPDGTCPTVREFTMEIAVASSASEQYQANCSIPAQTVSDAGIALGAASSVREPYRFTFCPACLPQAGETYSVRADQVVLNAMVGRPFQAFFRLKYTTPGGPEYPECSEITDPRTFSCELRDDALLSAGGLLRFPVAPVSDL